jgi:hypothetical protein
MRRPSPYFEDVAGAEAAGYAGDSAALPVQASHSDAAPAVRADDEPCAFYIEFRVAQNGVYGHSYIAYGRLNGKGWPVTVEYADVHPVGGFTNMVLGHFFPIPAETQPEEETLRRNVTTAYRRTLGAQDYEKLTAAVASARAACRWWNVFAYNCNDFVAEVARAIGLRTPRTIARPYEFIPALRELNEPALPSARERGAPAGLPQAASYR